MPLNSDNHHQDTLIPPEEQDEKPLDDDELNEEGEVPFPEDGVGEDLDDDIDPLDDLLPDDDPCTCRP